MRGSKVQKFHSAKFKKVHVQSSWLANTLVTKPDGVLSGLEYGGVVEMKILREVRSYSPWAGGGGGGGGGGEVVLFMDREVVVVRFRVVAFFR